MQQSHSFYHWYTVTYILREVLSYSTRHHFSHISKQSFVICGHIKVLCFNHHSFQSVIILNYRAVMSHITGGNNGRSPTLVGQGWQATGTNLWAKLVLKKLNICAMIICQCLVFENKTDDFWVRVDQKLILCTLTKYGDLQADKAFRKLITYRNLNYKA